MNEFFNLIKLRIKMEYRLDIIKRIELSCFQILAFVQNSDFLLNFFRMEHGYIGDKMV